LKSSPRAGSLPSTSRRHPTSLATMESPLGAVSNSTWSGVHRHWVPALTSSRRNLDARLHSSTWTRYQRREGTGRTPP
jgi:hypothetical protein